MGERKKETKIFTLNGEDVVVKKMRDISITVGELRAIKVDEFEGGCKMFKMATGKDDKFLDKITTKELNEVLAWTNI